nr:transposase [Colwellia sp. Bg11-28]
MCAYFTLLKGKLTDTGFIVSTTLKVCHNICVPRHKKFDYIAQRGKGTMGWFYGFKLHINVNYKSELVTAKLTTGKVHVTRTVAELVRWLTDKLYGDKDYC